MLRAVIFVFVSCALRCAVSLEEDSIKDVVRGLVDELGQLRDENVKRDEQLGQLKEDYLDLRDENVELRSQIADLKRDTTVFFSAHVTSGDFTVDAGNRILFPSVLANGGNSFNAADGVFTCPQTGHYMFSMNYASRLASRTNWRMYRESTVVAESLIEIDDRHYTASNTVIINCESGNKVYINCGTTNCRMWGPSLSTNFSGFFVGE